jgi:hypothetical protein
MMSMFPYSKRTLQSYFVRLNAINRLRWDGGPATLQLGGNIDWLPLDRCLCFPSAIKLQPLVSDPYLSSRKDILYGL